MLEYQAQASSSGLDLNRIREQLATPTTPLHLLRPWAYFATLAIIVVHRVNCWGRLLNTYLSFVCVHAHVEATV